MLPEIGSNLSEYSSFINKKSDYKSLWWQKPDYYKQYFKSGRNAIKGLCRLKNNLNCKALLPIFTCDTVVKPFVEEGWTIDFYTIDRNLEINFSSLKEKYNSFKPALIFLQSYFGFNTIKSDVIDWLKSIKNNNCLIVEDITQSLFSEHYLDCADYYVASLRKFLAIPDGGVLITRDNVISLELEEADEEICQVAIEAFDLKNMYLYGEEKLQKEVFLEKFRKLKLLIDDNSKIRRINDKSINIFNNFIWYEAIKKRIRNYNYLFDGLINNKVVSLILPKACVGFSPLYFPIYVKGERAVFQNYLSKQNIYCPIIWPRSTYISETDNIIDFIYKNIICIPIDQRYGLDDMGRILEAIDEYGR